MMNLSARDNYLTTEVMTATPQKLQLMLIEAALRMGQQTIEHWKANEEEQAVDTLIRCQQIITELLCGLQPDQDSELVRRVASVYLFIFRSLSVAHLERSEQKVADAMSVLEIERETWQQVCAKLGTRRDDEPSSESGLMIEA